jgi:hypothetical protein
VRVCPLKDPLSVWHRTCCGTLNRELGGLETFSQQLKQNNVCLRSFAVIGLAGTICKVGNIMDESKYSSFESDQ